MPELLLARNLELEIFLNFNLTKMHVLKKTVKNALLTFPIIFRYFEAKHDFLCHQTAASQALKN